METVLHVFLIFMDALVVSNLMVHSNYKRFPDLEVYFITTCSSMFDQGGYMNAKKQKLKQQFSEETPGQLRKENSEGSTIFAGVNIHVNGYTSKY